MADSSAVRMLEALESDKENLAATGGKRGAQSRLPTFGRTTRSKRPAEDDDAGSVSAAKRTRSASRGARAVARVGQRGVPAAASRETHRTRQNRRDQAASGRSATASLASSSSSVRSSTRSKSRSAAARGGRAGGGRTAGSRRGAAAAAPEPQCAEEPDEPEFTAESHPHTHQIAKALCGGHDSAKFGPAYRRVFVKAKSKDTFMTIQGTSRKEARESYLSGLRRRALDAVRDLMERRGSALRMLEGFEEAMRRAKESVEAQSEALRGQREEVAAELARLREEMAGTEAKLGAALQDGEAKGRRLEEAEARCAELEVQKEELDGVLSTLQEELEGKVALTREQAGRIERLEAEGARLAAELREAQEENEETRAALDEEAERAKEELRETTERLTSEAEAAAGEASSRIEAKTAELTEMTERAAGLDAELGELRRASEALERGKTEAEAGRKTAEDSLRVAQERLTMLNERMELMERSNKEAVLTLRQTGEAAESRARDAMERADRLQSRAAEVQDRVVALQTEKMHLEGDLREVRGEAGRLGERLGEATAELAEASKARDEAVASVARLEGEAAAVKASHAKATEEAAARASELEERLDEAQGRAASAEERVERLEKEAGELKTALEALRVEHAAAQAAGREARAKGESMERELAALRDAMGQTHEQQATALVTVTTDRDRLRARAVEADAMEARLAEQEELMGRLRDDLYEVQMARRGLHNRLQDARGAIRVYVRVRPVLPPDVAELAASSSSAADGVDDVPTAITCHVDGESLELCSVSTRTTKASASGEAAGPRRRKYEFGAVFGPRSSQEDVFDEVSMFVQSALDGFQVCLFSYGQTGSGKTHTMQGGDGDDRGLIPRSVEQILVTSRDMRRQGWEYTLEASFLEIYNEAVRDLLAPAPAQTARPGGGFSSGPAAARSKGLHIHMDAKEGQADVPGLTKVPVASTSAIAEVLSTAAASRSVASTSMNAQSSRSHSVFTLHIRGENARKGVVVRGKLNLCDLAGSERLDRSKAEGARLKETQAINKSLSNLAAVFTSLAKGAPHVPYRNSKLTQLLQPCFHGDGKTLMLVNLSPTEASAHESLCSLRFAATVATVQSGQAKKQVSAAPSAEEAAAASSSSSSSSAAAASSSSSSAARRPATARARPGAASARRAVGAARPTTAGGRTGTAAARRARAGRQTNKTL